MIVVLIKENHLTIAIHSELNAFFEGDTVKTWPGAYLGQDVNDRHSGKGTIKLVTLLQHEQLSYATSKVLLSKTRSGANQSHISIVVTCTLNAIFSLITCISNVAILHLIRKTRELHSLSFVLLFFFSLSVLLVGVLCQPFFKAYDATKLMPVSSQVRCTLKLIYSFFGWTTAIASYFTLCAISIYRLLALTLHLRYNTVVTIRRVLLTICLVSYTRERIKIVRRHGRQIHEQQRSVQINAINVLKRRKNASTILLLHGLFFSLYIPILVTGIMHQSQGYTTEITLSYIRLRKYCLFCQFLPELCIAGDSKRFVEFS